MNPFECVFPERIGVPVVGEIALIEIGAVFRTAVGGVEYLPGSTIVIVRIAPFAGSVLTPTVNRKLPSPKLFALIMSGRYKYDPASCITTFLTLPVLPTDVTTISENE